METNKEETKKAASVRDIAGEIEKKGKGRMTDISTDQSTKICHGQSTVHTADNKKPHKQHNNTDNTDSSSSSNSDCDIDTDATGTKQDSELTTKWKTVFTNKGKRNSRSEEKNAKKKSKVEPQKTSQPAKHQKEIQQQPSKSTTEAQDKPQPPVQHESTSSTVQARNDGNDYTLFLQSTSEMSNLAKEAERNPIKFNKEIIEKIGAVEKIKLNGKCIIIKCKTDHQKQKLMQTSELFGQLISVTEPWSKTRKAKDNTDFEGSHSEKGIIFGVPLELSEDEIRFEINADSVRRMKRRINGYLEDTPNVIISYTDHLPDHVNIGFMTFRVRIYIPRPFRCTRCQMFGHAADSCWRPACCPRCAGNHEFDQCQIKAEEPENHKCRNCHGHHSSAWTGCPVYHNIHQALEIKAHQKISYKEAVEKVKINQKEENAKIAADKLKTSATTTAEIQQITGLENATTETRKTSQNQSDQINTSDASQGSPLQRLLKICVVGLLICIDSNTIQDKTKTENFRKLLILQATMCGIKVDDTEPLLSSDEINLIIS